jgi:hypothetical protein
LDKICNELFVNSRGCYAEEEYDENGKSIYKPPPLDEVWLSEPERRERRVELEKQQDVTCRRTEMETREAKRHLKSTNDQEERLPDLEESDVESDDENLLPESSDNELGGENEEDEELDRFVDHPNPTPVRLNFGDKVDNDGAPEEA